MAVRKSSIRKVLRCGIERINDGQWCRGATHRLGDDGKHQFCATGLVTACAVGFDEDHTGEIAYPVSTKDLVAIATIEALYSALPKKLQDVPEDDEDAIYLKEDRIIGYNDQTANGKRRQKPTEIKKIFVRALEAVS